MKINYLKMVVLLLVFFVQFGFSQQQISGTVADSSGIPLPGVTVVVQGESNGTQTDFDGNYLISANEGQILEFSYLGMSTVRRTVGSQTVIDVTMTEDAQALGEVVVTALGIEKKRDDDLSSSTMIQTQAIARSGEPNVLQGLSGKTPGVSITQNSGDPGAGAYIQIRGQNTVLGSNTPLVVIDGVPVSNRSFAGNNAETGDTAGVVEQSRLNDIPASDIASVTILKSAAAAAVWGTSAANGVIVIKTKSGLGTGGKRMKVDLSASLSIDEVNVEHEKQSSYGQGSGGKWSGSSALSWGDRISDRSGLADKLDDESEAYFVGDQTGSKYYPIKTKNSTGVYNDSNRDQIFRTGVTQNYSLGISYAGNDMSSTYFGYSRVDQKGIINGQSDYIRNTLRFNHGRDFSDKLSGRINTSYVNVESNRIQTGSNLNGLYLGYLRTSPDFDNTDYSGTYHKDASDLLRRPDSHRAYRARQIGQGLGAIYGNPGWIINNILNPNTVNRFIVSPELSYKISDNMSITARYGVDFYLDERESFFPYHSSGDWIQGGYYKNNYSETIQNANIFLRGNNEFLEYFKLNWIIGYMSENYSFNRFSSSTNVFLNPDPSKQLIDNATNENILASQYNNLNQKNSGYYSLSFAILEDDILIDASGRFEKAATLKDTNFFPSFSIGYVLTNNLIQSDILSFAKIRGSWGQVGIEPSLYVNKDTFLTSTSGSQFWGEYLDGANYSGTVRRDNRRGNPNLTIETLTEFEIGADMRFFENKLSLGITYYDRLTEDGILEVEVPPSTGYSFSYENAAEISNTGFELEVNYDLFKSGDFRANIFGNFTAYKNIIEKLPNVSRYILAGFSSTSSAVVEGEPYAAIYGGRWERDEDGNVQLDANGFPDVDKEQGVIGDPNPDFRAGLGSAMSYKGLNFSFLFETSQGNDMWGGTSGVLRYFGIHPETAVESEAPTNIVNYSGKLIEEGTKFRGTVKDFGAGPVALDQSWYTSNGGGFGDVDEQFVYDASWIKLREITLSYSLPKDIVSSLKLSNLTFEATGRNLLLITDFEGVDPEINLEGASKGRGLDYFSNPATRSYVFSIKLSF